MSSQSQHIAIAGAGITGLACAYLLSESGYKVTIVARNFSGDESTKWASPWAGALLAPHPSSGSPDLQLTSLKFYHHLLKTHPESSIKEIRITETYDDRPSNAPIWYKNHVKNFTPIPTSSLPSGTTLGYSYTGLIVNPTVFLPWLTSQLKARGVTFVQRTITSLAELRTLTNASLVINATGLGARELIGDEKVYGVRGQTIFVPCVADKQDLLGQATLHQGSHYTYAIPRPSDGGVILGGVSQRENTSSVPDLRLRPDILKRVNELTDGRFNWVDLDRQGRDIVGFRPAREGGLRCEREGDAVHAYGVGALGYVYAFGVAEKVLGLVEGVKARL